MNPDRRHFRFAVSGFGVLLVVTAVHFTPAAAQESSVRRAGSVLVERPPLRSGLLATRVSLLDAVSAQQPLLLSEGSGGAPALDSGRPSAPRRTYWIEGGAIGLVALGVVSYFGYGAVANQICTGSDAGGCNDYKTRVTIGGAAVGFLVGALIGHRITKSGPTL